MIDNAQILNFFKSETDLKIIDAEKLVSQNNVVTLINKKYIVKLTQQSEKYYKYLERILDTSMDMVDFPRIISCKNFGKNFLILYKIIEGRSYPDVKRLYSSFWFQAGCALKTIHSLPGDSIKVPNSKLSHFSVNNQCSIIKEFLTSKKIHKILTTRILTNAEFSRVNFAISALKDIHPIKMSLLHGDYVHKNLIFDEGRLVGIIDWENAQFGDPLLELGYIYLWDGFMTNWNKILSGYSSDLKKWMIKRFKDLIRII